MTEKRFTMVNTNLVDDDGLVYYLIKKDGKDIVQVFGKHTAKKIINELNALHEEKEELQEVINEITYNTTKDKIEIEHINTIYKELGFDGVIDYAKDKLGEYGAVREVEDGLWVMATGGWSDHEHWINCLNDMTCFMSFRGHYIAWERGGAFYYTKEPYADVKVVKK